MSDFERGYNKALSDMIKKAEEMQWCGIGLEGISRIKVVVNELKKTHLKSKVHHG